jgi:hypothetical protein
MGSKLKFLNIMEACDGIEVKVSKHNGNAWWSLKCTGGGFKF